MNETLTSLLIDFMHVSEKFGELELKKEILISLNLYEKFKEDYEVEFDRYDAEIIKLYSMILKCSKA